MGMAASVVTYTVPAENAEELVNRVRERLVPAARDVSGYLGFLLLDQGEDRRMAILLFASVGHAHSGRRRAHLRADVRPGHRLARPRDRQRRTLRGRLIRGWHVPPPSLRAFDMGTDLPSCRTCRTCRTGAVTAVGAAGRGAGKEVVQMTGFAISRDEWASYGLAIAIAAAPVIATMFLWDLFQAVIVVTAFAVGYMMRPRHAWVVGAGVYVSMLLTVLAFWAVGYDLPKATEEQSLGNVLFSAAMFVPYLAAVVVLPVWLGRRFAERRLASGA